MVAKIKELYVKYEELFIYFIVGVLTTIVSWVACAVSKWFLDSDIAWQNTIIQTIGWVAGVLFAYPTNRKWVFKSTNPQIFREFISLAGSRVSTWILEIVIMYVTVNLMHMNYWISKSCIAAVLVTIANYVFSKLLVFRKKSDKNVSEEQEA